MRRSMTVGLAGGLLMLAAAAPAQGATTIGSDLVADAGNGSCANTACTFVQRALPGRPLTAPTDGVIVRWRLKVGGLSGSPSAALRVVRGTGAASMAVAVSESQPLVNSFTTEVFASRLPIAAGDYIGLDCCPGGAPTFGNAGVAGTAVDWWDPPLTVGDTRAPNGTETDIEYLYNADIEPDADHDGFGDETQDQCSSDAGTQGQCPVPVIPDADPPQTSITKGAPGKTSKHKVKFEFSSDEAGSTFECAIDKKGFKPCSSPKTVKRLAEGRHKFRVRATDSAGNPDSTPAKDRFKVVG